MRILDLFCGAGGAAMGYRYAFPDAEIVGVDIVKQPRYPFMFVQADAMTYPLEGFDLIHASPPCQHYSVTRHTHSREYPDLVGPIRARLLSSGAFWVIENVVGAPLIDPVTLCGAAFALTAVDDDGKNLVLKRHRLFECAFPVNQPTCLCRHYKQQGFMVGGVYGGGPSNRSKASWNGSKGRRGGYTPRHHVRAQMMGIDWMTQHELCESIPPAYTEYVGLWAARAVRSLDRLAA